MTSEKRKYKRKQLWINPGFQKNFLAYSWIITLSTTLIYLAVNLWVYRNYEVRGQQLGFSPNNIYFELLKEQKQTMAIAFLIGALLVCSFSFVYGLYMSNKIAGPVYRVQKFFNDMQNGDRVHELKFRKGDYFSELADEINRYFRGSQK